MKIIFCEDPLAARRPDEAYAAEANAAREMGFQIELVNHDVLTMGNALDATKRIKPLEQPETALYRGWMLTPQHYANLYFVLQNKGLTLLNTSNAFQHCHYLPESYSVIESVTPKSVWLRVTPNFSFQNIFDLLAPFGSRPIIVKDFVKSQKYYWHEACFIPSASDQTAVERVVKKFMELQGEGLAEGLVFREFIEFEPLVTHSKSGMPLTKEYRVFVLDGEPLASVEYWEEGDYAQEHPPLEQFQSIMRTVQSRFYTMDIAKTKAGQWMIVELGDGQVAGLPERMDVLHFYQSLKNRGIQ